MAYSLQRENPPPRKTAGKKEKILYIKNIGLSR